MEDISKEDIIPGLTALHTAVLYLQTIYLHGSSGRIGNQSLRIRGRLAWWLLNGRHQAFSRAAAAPTAGSQDGQDRNKHRVTDCKWRQTTNKNGKKDGKGGLKNVQWGRGREERREEGWEKKIKTNNEEQINEHKQNHKKTQWTGEGKNTLQATRHCAQSQGGARAIFTNAGDSNNANTGYGTQCSSTMYLL